MTVFSLLLPSPMDSKKWRNSNVLLTPLSIAVVSEIFVQLTGTGYLCALHPMAVPLYS